MKHKYELTPTPDEANWLLISMHSPLNRYFIKTDCLSWIINHFPSISEDKGCSTTVLWSGKKGFNTPTQTYGGLPFGIVINPANIIMPQADLIANGSSGKIVEEYPKKNTKYSKKRGYYRVYDFTTNLARNEHVQAEKSIYYPQGHPYVFAKNIWRKFNKNLMKKNLSSDAHFTVMELNEGIVFKKDIPISPIDGLLIRNMKHSWEYPVKGIEILLQHLTNNSSFKLYFYDDRATEHIIRYVDNTTAIDCLREYATTKDHLKNFNFDDMFAQAQPFQGFNVTDPHLDVDAKADLIKSIRTDIDAALKVLREKINQKTYSPIIEDVYTYLHFIADNYIRSLNEMRSLEAKKDIDVAFKQNCYAVVNEAKVGLMDEYTFLSMLTDWLKQLFNILSKDLTLKFAPRFFTLKSEQTEQFQIDIDTTLQKCLANLIA